MGQSRHDLVSVPERMILEPQSLPEGEKAEERPPQVSKGPSSRMGSRLIVHLQKETKGIQVALSTRTTFAQCKEKLSKKTLTAPSLEALDGKLSPALQRSHLACPAWSPKETWHLAGETCC